jgi:hypothetical protein
MRTLTAANGKPTFVIGRTLNADAASHATGEQASSHVVPLKGFAGKLSKQASVLWSAVSMVVIVLLAMKVRCAPVSPVAMRVASTSLGNGRIITSLRLGADDDFARPASSHGRAYANRMASKKLKSL